MSFGPKLTGTRVPSPGNHSFLNQEKPCSSKTAPAFPRPRLIRMMIECFYPPKIIRHQPKTNRSADESGLTAYVGTLHPMTRTDELTTEPTDHHPINPYLCAL